MRVEEGRIFSIHPLQGFMAVVQSLFPALRVLIDEMLHRHGVSL